MRAAPRDASWYNFPDAYSAKAVHIDNGGEFAACDSWLLLGSPAWSDASEVPEHIRCRRRACSKRYAEADGVP